MKKLLFLIIVASSLVGCSRCEDCYIHETVTATNSVQVTPIGEYCGSELDDIDGSSYTGNAGPAHVECD